VNGGGRDERGEEGTWERHKRDKKKTGDRGIADECLSERGGGESGSSNRRGSSRRWRNGGGRKYYKRKKHLANVRNKDTEKKFCAV